MKSEKNNVMKALYEEYGSLNSVALFKAATQPNCNIFAEIFLHACDG